MPSVRGIKEENAGLNHDHTQLEGGKGEPAGRTSLQTAGRTAGTARTM